MSKPYHDRIGQVEIAYNGFSNARRQQLHHAIQRDAWLFPTWLRNLRCVRKSNMGSAVASMRVAPQYHKAWLHVDDWWFTQYSESMRRHVVIHEMIHMHHLAAWNYADSQLKQPAQRAMLDHLGEQATDSLAFAIIGLASRAHIEEDA